MLVLVELWDKQNQQKHSVVTTATRCLANLEQFWQAVNSKLVTFDPVQLLLRCVMGKYLTSKTALT